MTMIPIPKKIMDGNGLRPKGSAKGVKGNRHVTTTTIRVVANKYVPGLLRKNGFRVRMIRTMSDAEITDSRNHPVLN